MKIGYQLKQVRERLAKGLVDKGVLRTEKRNFLLFDMATHPVSDSSVKEEITKRVVDTLLGQGPAPTERTNALICSAYAANVLENALTNLSHSTVEVCFNKVDAMLKKYGNYGENVPGGAPAKYNEVVCGVLSVFAQMDRLI